MGLKKVNSEQLLQRSIDLCNVTNVGDILLYSMIWLGVFSLKDWDLDKDRPPFPEEIIWTFACSLIGCSDVQVLTNSIVCEKRYQICLCSWTGSMNNLRTDHRSANLTGEEVIAQVSPQDIAIMTFINDETRISV